VQSTEKLTIDTPEQIALELPLAGIGSRFLALAFDSLIQFIVVVLIFIITALTSWTGVFSSVVPAFLAPILIVLMPFLIYWGYFTFFEIVWNGQTPGKRHASIRVIKESGRPITAIEAIGRNLMRAVDFLPFFYGAGIMCMMLNKQNKRLGDYVAGTVVVHEKEIGAVAPNWGDGSATGRAITAEVTKVTADELVLIETYLGRRYDLEPSVRYNSARQIAAIIEQKTGLQKQGGQSDDDFLETVARDVRDNARFR
jgi:uncharacterized RDD family membrane protein YckC